MTALGTGVRLAVKAKKPQPFPDLEKFVPEINKWVTDSLSSKVRKCFRDGKDPWGFPWVPLAPSTIEGRRRRNSQGLQILVDTGKMLSSLTTRKAGNISYLQLAHPARFHLYGTKRMPRRAFLPIQGGQVVLPDSWSRDIESYVGTKIASLFGGKS